MRHSAPSRYVLHHCGMDAAGNRHWRRKDVAAVQRCRKQAALFPRVVVVSTCCAGRVIWRNGMHQRRWNAVAAGVRGDRLTFLTTLPRPAMVSPLVAMPGW